MKIFLIIIGTLLGIFGFAQLLQLLGLIGVGFSLSGIGFTILGFAGAYVCFRNASRKEKDTVKQSSSQPPISTSSRDPHMSFSATCPHCQGSFIAGADYEGETVRCGKCDKRFVVERPANDEKSNDEIGNFHPSLPSRDFSMLNLFSKSSLWITIAVVVMGAINGIELISSSHDYWIGVSVICGSVLIGFILLFLRGIVSMLMAIEENTRTLAEILRARK